MTNEVAYSLVSCEIVGLDLLPLNSKPVLFRSVRTVTADLHVREHTGGIQNLTPLMGESSYAPVPKISMSPANRVGVVSLDLYRWLERSGFVLPLHFLGITRLSNASIPYLYYTSEGQLSALKNAQLGFLNHAKNWLFNSLQGGAPVEQLRDDFVLLEAALRAWEAPGDQKIRIVREHLVLYLGWLVDNDPSAVSDVLKFMVDDMESETV